MRAKRYMRTACAIVAAYVGAFAVTADAQTLPTLPMKATGNNLVDADGNDLGYGPLREMVGDYELLIQLKAGANWNDAARCRAYMIPSPDGHTTRDPSVQCNGTTSGMIEIKTAFDPTRGGDADGDGYMDGVSYTTVLTAGDFKPMEEVPVGIIEVDIAAGAAGEKTYTTNTAEAACARYGRETAANASTPHSMTVSWVENMEFSGPSLDGLWNFDCYYSLERDSDGKASLYNHGSNARCEVEGWGCTDATAEEVVPWSWGFICPNLADSPFWQVYDPEDGPITQIEDCYLNGFSGPYVVGNHPPRVDDPKYNGGQFRLLLYPAGPAL